MAAAEPPKAMTAAEAAKNYHRTVNNIHQYARRKKWRRIRLHGRLYYHGADVQRDLGRD